MEETAMPIQPRLSKPFALLWIALAVGGASLIAVGQPTAPGQASRTVPDADFDGDGVINALDNCLGAPNTDQRDSHHDGIGNEPCDSRHAVHHHRHRQVAGIASLRRRSVK